jgi:hypothetical protein
MLAHPVVRVVAVKVMEPLALAILLQLLLLRVTRAELVKLSQIILVAAAVAQVQPDHQTAQAELVELARQQQFQVVQQLVLVN